MSSAMKFVFLLCLLLADGLGERRDQAYDGTQQSGKSFFFLGGLIRRIKSRWQNQNQPPFPYGGGGPVFTGYYGCAFYNCRPPQQIQVFQPVHAIQPVQVQPIPAAVQSPILVQQAQVYQANTFAQAVAQGSPGPSPSYPIQATAEQPQQQIQYPAAIAYGNPQPTYGTPQPYQPYPVYPSAYASPVPGQVYQNAGCAFPGYLCARKT